MSRAIFIDIACSSEEEARRIARLLLEQNLAAACQIHPIQSFYWWEDEQHEAPEWLLRTLTEESLFGQIKELVFEEHSYELPEVVSTTMQDVPAAYLQWIEEYTTKRRGKGKAQEA